MALPAAGTAGGVVTTGAGVAAVTAGCGYGAVATGCGGGAYGAGAAAGGVSLSLAHPLMVNTSPARAKKQLRRIDISFRARVRALVQALPARIRGSGSRASFRNRSPVYHRRLWTVDGRLCAIVWGHAAAPRQPAYLCQDCTEFGPGVPASKAIANESKCSGVAHSRLAKFDPRSSISARRSAGLPAVAAPLIAGFWLGHREGLVAASGAMSVGFGSWQRISQCADRATSVRQFRHVSGRRDGTLVGHSGLYVALAIGVWGSYVLCFGRSTRAPGGLACNARLRCSLPLRFLPTSPVRRCAPAWC